MRLPQNGLKIMETPTKMDDEQGYPYFRKPPNKEHHGLGGPTLKKNQRANFPHDLQMWNMPMNWSIILLEGSYHILEDVSLVCRGSWYPLCIHWTSRHVEAFEPIWAVKFHFFRSPLLATFRIFQRKLIPAWWFGTWFLSIYREFHHPNWRTHIFQRGRSTTNQMLIIMVQSMTDDLENCKLWPLWK